MCTHTRKAFAFYSGEGWGSSCLQQFWQISKYFFNGACVLVILQSGTSGSSGTEQLLALDERSGEVRVLQMSGASVKVSALGLG